MDRFAWFFNDKDGNRVITQPPNAPMIICCIAAGAGLLTTGVAKLVLAAIAALAMLVWAGLELFSGVSPFRRVLGGATLLFVVLIAGWAIW